jgi:hypothetical protein
MHVFALVRRELFAPVRILRYLLQLSGLVVTVNFGSVVVGLPTSPLRLREPFIAGGIIVVDTSEMRSAEEWGAAVHRAAHDLAGRLRALADSLSAQRQPIRIRYGPGRVGEWFRRQSPEGFLLDPASRQMLLPDGRLWFYSRTDATRFPAGRFYDARTDYSDFAGMRTFPGGREFVYLGAVIGKYTFGCAGLDGRDLDDLSGLCAISGEGGSVRHVSAGDAFDAIARPFSE